MGVFPLSLRERVRVRVIFGYESVSTFANTLTPALSRRERGKR